MLSKLLAKLFAMGAALLQQHGLSARLRWPRRKEPCAGCSSRVNFFLLQAFKALHVLSTCPQRGSRARRAGDATRLAELMKEMHGARQAEAERARQAEADLWNADPFDPEAQVWRDHGSSPTLPTILPSEFVQCFDQCTCVVLLMQSFDSMHQKGPSRRRSIPGNLSCSCACRHASRSELRRSMWRTTTSRPWSTTRRCASVSVGEGVSCVCTGTDCAWRPPR